jgi:hypothetical protein
VLQAVLLNPCLAKVGASATPVKGPSLIICSDHLQFLEIHHVHMLSHPDACRTITIFGSGKDVDSHSCCLVEAFAAEVDFEITPPPTTQLRHSSPHEFLTTALLLCLLPGLCTTNMINGDYLPAKSRRTGSLLYVEPQIATDVKFTHVDFPGTMFCCSGL